jgi:hypothetical protein
MTFTDLKPAVLGSVALVLPFAILQAFHMTLTRQNAPGLIVLFGLLWLLPLVFLTLLMSIVRCARTANRFSLALRVVAVAAIALLWATLLVDQMPCFMGVPNCD